MQEKILAILKSLGLVPADKEDAVKTALAEIKPETTAPVIDPSKLNDPQMKQFITDLAAQLSVVTESNKTLQQLLAAEKTAREGAINAAKSADAEQKKTNAEKLIGDALKAGKIAEADKQKYIDKAIADHDGTKGDIERFATIPGFKPAPDAGGDKNKPGEQQVSKIRGPLASADATILGAMAKMEATQ
ncbi:TPA: hypothetical protein DD449_02585 [Candidatus Berkelbacteria bacterium]|nr:hypothetical protein [Candidatus Berkelbacteria bacterium]